MMNQDKNNQTVHFGRRRKNLTCLFAKYIIKVVWLIRLRAPHPSFIYGLMLMNRGAHVTEPQT